MSVDPAIPRLGFSGQDAPSFDILNTCVHCGLCLPHCPTYVETLREQSSPRGRLRLMRSVSEGRLDVLDRVFAGQMYECLDCRACEAVCPSGVLYGQVLEPARAQVEQARAARGRRSPAERLVRRLVFDRIFGDMRLFRVVSGAARLYQRSGAQWLARRTGVLRALRLERMEGQLPRLSRHFFVPRGQVFSAYGERQGRVALLAGCIMHTAYAEVNRATVRVLRRNGWEVVLPSAQGCCGALHVHAGEAESGRRLMRLNVEAFESCDAEFVVNNAAGCGAALKEYGHHLADDPEWAARAATFSERVRDVTELLASRPLRESLGRIDITVTYQEPCHLAHAQRIASAPRALLKAIPGLRLEEMEESSLCCGSAGIYSVTQPKMSAELLERKLVNALATGASVIASANPGCMLQVEAGLRRRGQKRVRVMHVVELLDEAYRRGERQG